MGNHTKQEGHRAETRRKQKEREREMRGGRTEEGGESGREREGSRGPELSEDTSCAEKSGVPGLVLSP